MQIFMQQETATTKAFCTNILTNEGITTEEVLYKLFFKICSIENGLNLGICKKKCFQAIFIFQFIKFIFKKNTLQFCKWNMKSA